MLMWLAKVVYTCWACEVAGNMTAKTRYYKAVVSDAMMSLTFPQCLMSVLM